ncbi:hypothetical protein GC167_05230 [bacterium]|nr:hypothetical protein [bacterium]
MGIPIKGIAPDSDNRVNMIWHHHKGPLNEIHIKAQIEGSVPFSLSDEADLGMDHFRISSLIPDNGTEMTSFPLGTKGNEEQTRASVVPVLFAMGWDTILAAK